MIDPRSNKKTGTREHCRQDLSSSRDQIDPALMPRNPPAQHPIAEAKYGSLQNALRGQSIATTWDEKLR